MLGSGLWPSAALPRRSGTKSPLWSHRQAPLSPFAHALPIGSTFASCRSTLPRRAARYLFPRAAQGPVPVSTRRFPPFPAPPTRDRWPRNDMTPIVGGRQARQACGSLAGPETCAVMTHSASPVRQATSLIPKTRRTLLAETRRQDDPIKFSEEFYSLLTCIKSRATPCSGEPEDIPENGSKSAYIRILAKVNHCSTKRPCRFCFPIWSGERPMK